MLQVLSYKRKLNDYPIQLKKNADTIALDAAGISMSDLRFIGKNSGGKQIFSDEALRILSDKTRISITAEYLYNEICLAMKYSSMIWFFLAGSMLMSCKRKGPLLFLYTLMIALIESVLMLLGRNPARVYESVLFTGTIDALIGCRFVPSCKFFYDKKDSFIYTIIIVNILFASFLVSRDNLKNLLDTKLYKYIHLLSEADLDIIDNDSEHTYIMPAEAFVTLAIPDNIFINYDALYCSNMLYQDGFFCDLPCFKNIVEKNNVQNTIELMYHGDQEIYSAYSESYISILENHGVHLNIIDQTMVGPIKLVQYNYNTSFETE